MNSERIGNDTVKIAISGKELIKLGLSVDVLSRKSPEAAAAISAVMIKYFPETELAGKELEVELYPVKDGGCVLYVTVKGLANRLRRKILSAGSVNEMKKLCGILKSSGVSLTGSSLTAGSNVLHLTADIPDNVKLPETIRSAEATPTVLAYIAEHDRIIFPKNGGELILRA